MIENTADKKVSDIDAKKLSSATSKPQVQKISINGPVKGKIYESLVKAQVKLPEIADKLPAELQEEQKEEVVLVDDSEKTAENTLVADASAAGGTVVSDAGGVGAGAGSGSGAGVGAGAGAAAGVAAGMSPLVLAGGLLAVGAAAGGGGGGGSGGARDVTPPNKPAISLDTSADPHLDQCDDATSEFNTTESGYKGNDNTPTVRVSLDSTEAVAGDVVKLYADGNLVGTVTLSSTDVTNGYVLVTSSTLVDGDHQLTATITDQSHNESLVSDGVDYIVDTYAHIEGGSLDKTVGEVQILKGVTISGTVDGVEDQADGVTINFYSDAAHTDLLGSVTVDIVNGGWSYVLDHNDPLAETLGIDDGNTQHIKDIYVEVATEDSLCNTATADLGKLVYDPTAESLSIDPIDLGLDQVLSPCDLNNEGSSDSFDVNGNMTITGSFSEGIALFLDSEDSTDPTPLVLTAYKAGTSDVLFTINISTADINLTDNTWQAEISKANIIDALDGYDGSIDFAVALDETVSFRYIDGTLAIHADFLAPALPEIVGFSDNTSRFTGNLLDGYADGNTLADEYNGGLYNGADKVWINDGQPTISIQLSEVPIDGDVLKLYDADHHLIYSTTLSAQDSTVEFTTADIDPEYWEELGIDEDGYFTQGDHSITLLATVEDKFCNETDLANADPLTINFSVDTIAPDAPTIGTPETYDPPSKVKLGDTSLVVYGYYNLAGSDTESPVTPMVLVDGQDIRLSPPNDAIMVSVDPNSNEGGYNGYWEYTFRAKDVTYKGASVYTIETYALDEAGNASDADPSTEEIDYNSTVVILGDAKKADYIDVLDMQKYAGLVEQDATETNVDAIVFTFGGGDTVISGNGNDLILGGQAKDSLYGGGGNDFISGGDSDLDPTAPDQSDTLNGGLGNDTLEGGKQADYFVFDTALDSVSNVDLILDFSGTVAQADKLVLSHTIFAALGGTVDASELRTGAGVTTAADGDDYLIYDTSTGNLYYDADGAGGDSSAVLFAVLENKYAVTSNDFLIA